MKCCNCSREIPENSLYCNWCGKKQLREKEKKLKIPAPRQLPSGSWTYRNGADTQTITIEPIFQLIEILLNHPALPINGKRFKCIGNAVASKSKIPRRFDRLIDFA